MSMFAKLLHRPKAAAPVALADVACPHTVLTPRWDNAADIGHEDRATGYTCESCHQHFTAPQARTLRQTEGERVRQLEDYPTPR